LIPKLSYFGLSKYFNYLDLLLRVRLRLRILLHYCV
jgi:hypothetical protein